jgi:hypothetical protein
MVETIHREIEMIAERRSKAISEEVSISEDVGRTGGAVTPAEKKQIQMFLDSLDGTSI